ncbi:MAG: VanW family protein [Ardenticatenales bacterium]|nr:VanW family protein [Ardenticatenales bacterium]
MTLELDHAPQDHPTPSAHRITRRGAWPVLVLAGVLALVLVPSAYRWRWAEHVLPGVRVAAVHVGGLDRDAAAQRLQAAGLDAAVEASVRADDFRTTIGSEAIGLDIEATLDAAFAVGRAGSRPAQLADLVRTRFGGRTVVPLVRVDRDRLNTALHAFAADIDAPAQDARLVLETNGVTATEALPGRALDVVSAATTLQGLAEVGTWPLSDVQLPVNVLEPGVTDVGPALERARVLAAGTVELSHGDLRWTLEPAQLVGAMTVVTDAERVRLAMAPAEWSALLAPVTAAVSRTAQAPRFDFDPETGHLAVVRPAEDALVVNVERTAERVLALGAGAERVVAVAVDRTPPPITNTVSADELGIRELVAENTSYYVGSAPGRVTNVRIAALRYDGLVIPKDAVFSFNEFLGDVSAAEGYQKTLIILDGATADGIGGGVCQVSTTLFRAAFWAGLPIVERWAHGYRVGYYEQHSGPGLDATVYSPTVDLKFRNDTGAALLIEAEPNPRAMTLTFRLYGTKPAREVEMEGPFTTNITPPPAPRVEVDPSLPPGASESKELARNGASVSVRRIVRVPGQPDRVDTYHSRYVPTGALTLIGPPAAPPAEFQASAPAQAPVTP